MSNAFFIAILLTRLSQERAKAAASLKAKGNAAYQAKQFSKAADLYTRAIAVTPTPEPVFYSNRAACSSFSHRDST